MLVRNVKLSEVFRRYPARVQFDSDRPIIENVDHTEDWHDLFDGYETSSGCSRVINDLVLELERDGKFRNPIVVSLPGCNPERVKAGLCDDTRSCCPEHVEMGYHRLAAYRKAGFTEAEVAFLEPDETLETTGDLFELTYPQIPTLNDDQFDALMESFSFPLDENEWFDNPFVATNGDEVCFLVELSDDKYVRPAVERMTTILSEVTNTTISPSPQVVKLIISEDDVTDIREELVTY